jgi:UPF0042 nucleotide-binding protein
VEIDLFSFGYKHGDPRGADLVFDVRFLPNPYWVPELRDHTGREEAVARYALGGEEAARFFALMEPLLLFLCAQYAAMERERLTVAIGCTGGRHRSVAVSERLARLLASRGWRVSLRHRDIDKG